MLQRCRGEVRSRVGAVRVGSRLEATDRDNAVIVVESNIFEVAYV
jgi:hypothetical protein